LNQSSSQPWWRELNRTHWLVFATACAAWLFDCLDQQLFNLARDAAMDDLVIDKARAAEFASYTTSIFLLGWAAGGLTLGALGDRYGRARMLTISVLIYSVCTGLNAFASTYTQFCAYRFITGVGIGGVFGLSVALIADSLPDRSRSPALVLLQSLSAAGNISAAFLGMYIGSSKALLFGLHPWQAMFVLGTIPAFISVFVLYRIKEPIKWVEAKAAGIKTGIRFGSYFVLLGNKKWRTNALLGLAICSVGIIGLWGIGNFHPRIVRSVVEQHLATKHLSDTQMASAKAYWSSVAMLLQNIGAFFGITVLAKFAEAKGRKPAFTLALMLSFIATLMVFKGLREFNQIFWMIPIMGFCQNSIMGLYSIYLPELFPTSLRSTGTSFAYNFGRIAAASAPFTIGVITRSLGGNIEGFRTAGSWVSLILFAGLFIVPFLPETKGLPLPEEN